MDMRRALWGISMGACGAVSCASSAPDARYPAHEAGCPVKSFPGEPPLPVDELGLVTIECGSGRIGCERRALDVVCARGGDVAWGLADNALTATTLVVHAAHTRRAIDPMRRPGCVVHAFVEPPPFATENIGPVEARCAPDDAEGVCLRVLEDQVCALGGDVVWQIEGPTLEATSSGSKQRMRGRAAHSK
jgi:hypothetical protein